MTNVAAVIENRPRELDIWYPYLHLKEAQFSKREVGPGTAR